MAKTILLIHEFDQFSIPLKVVKEYRSSVRISIAKKSAILRLPSLLPGMLNNREIDKAKVWLTKTIKKDPKAFSRFLNQQYPAHFVKEVMGRPFDIKIERLPRETNTGKLRGNQMILKISDQLSAFQEKDVIKKLLSRLFAKHFQPIFSQRVAEINAQYFEFEYQNIRLKYNQSNWGSCSSRTNLNFSTRLLLAPQEVIDYVIIHELSHLKEMNHSPRFWKLVRDVMPDYKKKEAWLKKYGGECDY